MEDDCLREELYHFFGRSDETPSKAAFYHQRAKLKDGALWELLQIFNQKFQPTLYSFQHIDLPDRSRKLQYQVNFSEAVKICRDDLRNRTENNAINVESLIANNIEAIRPNRTFRRQARFKLPMSFCYR